MISEKPQETGADIELTPIRRLLLIQVDNKIGDLLTATSLFAPLHTRYGGLEIDVLAGPVSAPLLDAHPEVRRVFVYNKRKYSELPKLAWQLNRRAYDLSVNFESHVSSTTRWLTRLIGARHNLGFNKVGVSPYAISLVDESFAGHITRKHQAVLHRLGADGSIHYRLPMDTDRLAKAANAWPVTNGQARVLVNCFGSCAEKTLPPDQTVNLLRQIAENLPEASVRVSVPPGTTDVVKKIIAAAGIGQSLAPVSNLLDFAANVALADLVLTPDTSVVHFAAAFDKPQLAFYGDPLSRKLWGPNSVHALAIFCPGSLANLPNAVIEAALQRFKHSGTVHD